MEKVIKVRKEHRNKLKAVTHLDNSARVQTVNKRDNADFHRVLDHFNWFYVNSDGFYM